MRAFLIAAILVACCIPAWCVQEYSALVVGAPVDIANPTSWIYTLTNTSSSSSFTVWLLAIEIDEGTDVTNIHSPSGWSCDWSVPHFINWMYVSGELPAGESLSGFQADYSREPELQSWTVMFNNTDNPGETPTDFGTVSLLSVPEPSSIVALLVGVTALCGRKRRKHS
ncbi:MAG: PEP-CTERM sorting domain-containing protein [Armatimonadota bacterium]|nr:PEP-CTERM sorting domain-containing protein [bacterium]